MQRSICLVLVLLGVGILIVITSCGGGGTITTPPPAIMVSVSAVITTVQAGASTQITATVANDSSHQGVTWAVACPAASCGTVSAAATASGTPTTYSAPTPAPAGDLAVTITATSVADSSASNFVTVTVPGITISIAQSATTVPINTKAQLTATVSNDPTNKGVSWTVACGAAQCGTISPVATASGVATTYTAPTMFPAGDLAVTITATSVVNTSASNSAAVTVPGTTVLINQNTDTVLAGGKAQLTAAVTNDPTNKGVTWTVACSPAPCGSVSPTATASGTATTYTAPSVPPANDLPVTITATSVFNTSALSTANVTVSAVVVSAAPAGALLPANIAQQFTATLNNDPANKGVTWTLTQNKTPCSPTCGTISSANSASGIPITYTAPAKAPANAAVTLTATSVEDTTKSASATITISDGSVELVPDILALGSVVVNRKSKSQSSTLTNTGNSALSITSISITGTDPGDFSQKNTCSTSVGAGQSCAVTVTFSPKTTGFRSADVSISDSSTDSPQQVSLSGEGFTERGGLYEAAVSSALAQTGIVAVPFPEGPNKVGTRVMELVDAAREDPYLANGSKRALLVRFWYPTSLMEACKPAEYASPKVWSHFSQLLGVQLPEVLTNSCGNAPVADGVHPVVVFTPGYTATFTDYTFILEDLASRGYIVASVDHTFEATAVEFPDGGLVKSVFGSHLGGQWRGDNQALSYAISVRMQDLKFVMNELQRLSVRADSPFAGKLDMSRVAMAGHSMGGATAFLAMEQDPRVKAAVIVDGFLSSASIKPTQMPVLLLGMGRQNWNKDECRLWSNLQGARLGINLQGAEHVTPSDAVWLAKYAIKTGPMGPDKTIAALRDYIAAFLDANLGRRSLQPLLNGSSIDYPDAAVTTPIQPLCGERAKRK